MITKTPRTRTLALFATASTLAVASMSGTAHAVTVDGQTVTVPGSQASPWNISGGLIIGQSNPATVDVNNGGQINITNCAPLILGFNVGGNGTLLIHDPGSKVDNGNCGTQVSFTSSSTMTISNGGVLSALGGSVVGGPAGTTATATVTGAGSKWSFSGMTVGTVSDATLNVLNGGEISNVNCGTFTVGSGFNGVGVVNVGGQGSHWGNGGCILNLGGDGSGALNITGGGVVDGIGQMEVGQNFNISVGAITVSGTGSTLAVTNSFDVGEQGQGTLSITSGGTVTSGLSNIGDGNQANGAVTVDGSGSTWTSTSSIFVGRNGVGAMTISNGGKVISAGGAVSGGVSGNLTVSGAGSSWTSSNSLDLGNRGTSTVSITNGGVVAGTNGAAGTNTNAIANITIDGAGSAWNSTGSLTLGNGSSSNVQLKVQNGGALSNAAGSFGAATILVTGPGSTWTNTTLRVGSSQVGTLTISNQGQVNAPGGVVMGQSSSSSGIVNIGGASGQPAASPGTLNTPTVALGTGNGSQGTLNFNHTSVGYQFTPLISGPGKVNVTAGLTALSSDNTYTGLTTIAPGATLQLGVGGATGSITGNVTNDGTLYFIRNNTLSYSGAIGGSGALHVFGSNSQITLTGVSTYTGGTFVDAGALIVNGVLGSTAVSVNSAATLGGSGSVGGTVAVANSGILKGVAGQTLTTGALALAPASLINVSLGAPSSTRLFNINGDLTLDGTLNITDAGGFGAGLYRLFDYTGSLTDNTLNIGSLPSGVAAAGLTVQTATAHQVNLLFGAPPAAVPFWNGSTTTPAGSVVGGAGTWKLGPNNWTDANGANSGPWDGTMAIFAGASGAVTIDNSAGQVTAETIQFAVNGYSVGGGALDLNGVNTPTLRVGDGTPAGANYTATIGSVIKDSSFVKTDLGTLVLTAANTFNGSVILNGGFVSVGADNNLGPTGNLLIFSGGGLIATSSFASGRGWSIVGGEVRTAAGTTLTETGSLTGSGALLKTGAGSLVLNGTSSFNGVLTIAAGTGEVNGSLGSGAAVVQSGAGLGGNGSIGGAVTVANGGALLGAAGQTLTTGALTLNNASIVDVSLGAPSTTRLFNVNGALVLDGQLNITNAGAMGQGLYRLFDYTGALTDNGLVFGTLPGGFQAGQFSLQTSLAHQVNLVVGAPSATSFWNGTTTSPAGSVVGGAGTWKLGPSNWTDANGANVGPWDGALAIFAGAAGTVTVDNSAGQVGANAMQFAVNGYSIGGGTLDLSGVAPSIRVGDGSAAGQGMTATIGSVLTGTSGFTKTDQGTLVLAGTNTYTGVTTINGGFVSVGADANLGAIANGLNLNGGGLLSTAPVVMSRSVSITPQGGELRTTGGTLTLTGAFNGSGPLFKSGASALNITGNGAGFTGAVNVAGGRFLVNGTLGAGSVTVQSGASVGGSGSIAGAVQIANGGILEGVQGQTLTTGALTMGANSILQATLGAPGSTALVSVSGALTLDGNLQVTDAGGFGQGLYRLINYTGALTDNGLGVGTMPGGFQAGQFSIQTSIANQVNLVVAAPAATPFWNGATTSPTGTVAGGNGTWRLGTNNWTDAAGANAGGWDGSFGIFAGAAGAVTVDSIGGAVSATGMQFAVGGYSVGGATLTLTGATPTIRVGDGTAAGAGMTVTVNNVLAGANGLIKTDLGTLILGGANTYTGGTTINAGTLSVSADSGLGGAGAVTFGGGALAVNGTFQTFRNFAFTGAGEIRTSPTSSLNIAGTLSGSGAFAKTGSGILILANANNGYSGAATVAAGTLRLNGAMAGSFQVQSGATLGGAGSTTGTVNVANGGTLLGIQGQTLTTGALMLSPTSIIQTTLGAPGALALFHVSGNLVLDGQLNVSSPGGFGVGLYRIIDYTGTLTDNGLSFGVTPASVAQSQLSIQTAIAGQVNLVVANPPILFWNGAAGGVANGQVAGGTGTWKIGPTNWTDANGASAFPWNSDFGVFAGAAGVVTVDGSAGGISANGLQFATSGYTVGGAALTLTGAAPTLRVGDGTAAGAGFTATINSAVAGTNGLVKTDLGTLVLGGTNTYGGGTTVNGGFVSVGSDANLGAAAGAVTLNGGGLMTTSSFATGRTLAFAGAGEVRTNAGVTLTLNGLVSGAGAFTKSGAGTLILTGAESYSGAVAVNGGTLRVDGALPGTVGVQNGARLQGTGSVGATSIASGGTLAAGDSIGALTVVGNATFASGSNLEAELNAAGQADLVHATGNVTIQGGSVTAMPAAGTYTLGSRYTVVTADGLVNGTFTALTNPALPMPFLKLGLSYDARHVYLDVVRNSVAFCSVAQTDNQCAAANGADSLGGGKAVFNAIANLNDAAAARAAFDAISGEIGPAAKGVALEDSRFVREAAELRVRSALAGDVHGAWGQLYGSWGHGDSDGNAGALHRNLGGFLLGADMALGEAWRAGLMGGYSRAAFDVGSRASRGADSAYHLGVYGGAQAGAWGARLGAAIAWHDVSTVRAAAFPGFADALAGDYHARAGQLFGEVGYRWTAAGGEFEPYGGLAHVMLHTDGFTEAGGGAALTSAPSSQAITFSSLGMRGQTNLVSGGAEVRLHAGAAWRHAFGEVTQVSRFTFAAGGTAFDIAGLPIARDVASLEVGAGMVLFSRARLDVSYSGQVGKRVSDHGARATLSVAF